MPSERAVIARRSTTAATEQLTFSCAEDAIQTMLHALANVDQVSLLRILGPDADELLSSESGTEQQGNRVQNIQKGRKIHRLANDPDGTAMLYIGAGIWPIPVPLVRRDTTWYFDTEAGKQEIVYRRMGENELMAIKVCHELMNAQKEYDSQQRHCKDGTPNSKRARSDRGKLNDGHWRTEPGEDESLLGQSLALADSEGNMEDASQKPKSFHGYFFRALRGQAPAIRGASRSGPADRGVRRCVGFLAYPAEYGSSGVMTFLVDEDGVAYEKDLGRRTIEIVKSVTQVTLDKTWWKAEAGASL